MSLALPAAATVGDLRAAIDARRSDATPYLLRTAFPVRAVLDRDDAGLAAARLVPRGVVYMSRA